MLRQLIAIAPALASAIALSGCLTSQVATTPEQPGNSRLIFWSGCDDLIGLTDDQLDEWKAEGVDGFVCMTGYLSGLGGDQQFTGDPQADLSPEAYALQRSIRESQIVDRADARGIKLYLGAYLASYTNTSTPLADWFDDAAWSESVLPRMADLAAAAKSLGFAGLAFDQELYPQTGGVQTATWAWSYPGNTQPEDVVRAKVRQRGEELMSTLLEQFPGLELAAYATRFPDSWEDLVQEQVNDVAEGSAPLVFINFWDGMTSVDGYGEIRFWDSVFYKAPHFGTWDTALTYNTNRTYALLSRALSNWDHAADHVQLAPFAWIDAGPDPGTFDDARPGDYVAEQLLAFAKWSAGGEFANFVYGALTPEDYEPYAVAMHEASSVVIEDEPPTVSVATQQPDPGSTVQGDAGDDLAIRVVRWRDDRGGSGVAALDWQVLSGDYDTGYTWRMRWSVPRSALADDANELTVVAEDIKGNESAPAVYSLG